MLWIEDTYDSTNAHEAEQESRLRRRPVCSQCGDPIQEDEAYNIDGQLWCGYCIRDAKISVEDIYE